MKIVGDYRIMAYGAGPQIQPFVHTKAFVCLCVAIFPLLILTKLMLMKYSAEVSGGSLNNQFL